MSSERLAVGVRFDLVCFGQQNWTLTWTEKQQHATRLAARGHRVLYVDRHAATEPATPASAVGTLFPAATGKGAQQFDMRVWVHTHHHAPVLGWRLNEARRPRILRAVARRLGLRAPVVLAFHADAAELMEAVGPAVRVYYAVDELSAFGDRPDEERRRIREREDAILRRSDVAFGVSPRLVERFRAVQPNSHLLENGVDPAHFHPERLAGLAGDGEIRRLPRPRLGFVGQIDERMDQRLIVSLARLRRDWQIVLIGRVKRGVDVSAMRAEPNIRFVGFRGYDALPRVMHELDVGLVPYRSTVLTQSCNPSKTLEYVAAGLPVVSTPLEGIGACRPVTRFATDGASLVLAVEEALAAGQPERDRRLAIATANSWEHRTDVLEAWILDALERSAVEAGR